MTDTMPALVMTDINKLEVLDVPKPQIQKPTDVLLKVKSVGICGSDLHGYTGQSGRRIPPIVMGHEVAADVIAVGEACQIAVGSRVAIQPVQRNNPSPSGFPYVMGVNCDGAYAPYVCWPEENLFPIPDSLSYEHGSLTEPLGVTLHAVSIPRIQPYDTAFIAGAGPIGLLTLTILKQTGVRRIAISDLSDSRLALAQSIGADVTINPKNDDLGEVIKNLTDGVGVDVAFEAVGISATAQQTLEATRNNGTVIWIGNNHRMINIDMQAIVTRELSVLGSYGMTDRDFLRALQMLSDGQVPSDILINKTAELADGPELFDYLIQTPDIIKCVMNFD